MRNIYLLFLLLWTYSLTGQEVSVGNGTLQNFLPVNVGYYYSYSQQIYPGSTIGYSGTITELKFYLPTNALIDNSNDWKVYLGQTTKTSFTSNTDWIPASDMTNVFNGTVTNVNGVVTITLSTSFYFNHTNYNLVIAVDENKSGYNGVANQFYEHSGVANNSICYFSDTTNPNPGSIPPTISGVRSPNRSNITLLGIGPTCVPPSDLTSSDIGGTYATISWIPPNPIPSDGYEYYVSTSNTLPPGASTGTTNTSVALNDLSPNSAYYYWVRSYCGGTEYTAWAGPMSFTTLSCDPVDVPYTQDFQSATPPALPECTTLQQAGSGDVWKTSSTGGGNGFTTRCLRYFYNSSPANTWFYLKGLTLQAGKSYTVFYKYGGTDISTEKLRVAYGSAPINTAMNNTLADHPAITGSPYTNSVNFTVPSTGIYFIGFQCYSAANQYFLNLDDIVVTETPTCFPPTALTASAVTMTTATILWTPPAQIPSNGYEYFISTNNTPPGASGIVVSGPTANLTDLSPNTTYYFWVRSFCGGTDYSTWSGPSNFKTQALAGVPWSETFPNNASNPVGWTLGYNWNVGSARGVTGNPAYNLFDNFYSDHTTSSFATINVGPIVSGNKLRFDYKASNYQIPYNPPATGSGSFVVAVSTDQGQTYTTIETVTNDGTAGWRTKAYSLESYIGQNVKIKITGNRTSGDWDYGFDNFYIKSCTQPTALTYSVVTTTTATIAWTPLIPAPANGYEYFISTNNTPPGTSGIAVSGPTANLTDLSPNTTYYFWVRSRCDVNEFSGWAGPANFKTLCSPGSIPLNEGFESGYADQATVGGCWTQQSISGAQAWTANSSITSFNRAPHTGNFNAYLRYSNEDWLFYPITLTEGIPYIFSVSARQDGASPDNAKITLAYGLTSSAASMTNIVVNAQGITNGSYQEVSGIFTPESSGTYYIGIKGFINSIASYLSIDDISVTLVPPCLPPDNLTSASVTSTTATISWAAPAPAPSNGYEYFYSTTNTPPGDSGTSNSGLSSDLSGLMPNTTYYFWVRSHCLGADFSDWSASQSFKTKVVNDEASGAVNLTLGAGCTSATYTNVNATADPTEPLSLSTANYATVWYSFTAPSSGGVRVSTDGVAGTLTNTRLAIYSSSDPANYTTFIPISADEDGGISPSLNSVAYAVGLTSGQTYYIQVDKFASGTTAGSFCIKVDELTAAMLSSSASCKPYTAIPGANSNYTGWLNINESSTGKLMMQVRRPAGGVSPNSYTSGFVDIATNGIRQTYDGRYYLNRDYVLNNTYNPQPSGNYEIRFFFLKSERDALAVKDANAAVLSNLNITRDPGVNTCGHNAGPSGADNQLLTQTASGNINDVEWVQVSTPGFSRFFVNTGSIPLPVDIRSFEAHTTDNRSVKISWNVAEEVNVASYTVERSIDGHNFQELAIVSATNHSSYNLIDPEPAPGTNYYRLRITDYNASVQFSEIRQVSLLQDRSVSLYPNPTTGLVYLSGIGTDRRPVQLSVYDIMGQEVWNGDQQQLSEAKIDMSHYPKGVYFVRIVMADGYQASLSFIKS